MASRKKTRKRKTDRVSPAIVASSPLTRFLNDIFQEDESRLAFVAVQTAEEPFDLEQFRKELTGKLQRLEYPQPPERKDERKPSFYEHLEGANGTEIVLNASTLQEIWNCLLIPRIIGRDRKLEQENKSVFGYPIPFHRKLYREAEKRLAEIEKLVADCGATEWMNEYRLQLQRQFRENIKLVLLSRRYTGGRKELLTGQPARNLEQDPHDESVAAQVAVYWVLWTRLHGKEKMSDRFIRQLSLLVNAPAQVENLRSDEALRFAIEHDTLGWRQLLKIP
jgi:hypothetical protein